MMQQTPVGYGIAVQTTELPSAHDDAGVFAASSFP